MKEICQKPQFIQQINTLLNRKPFLESEIQPLSIELEAVNYVLFQF